jgi:hypothetical protein
MIFLFIPMPFQRRLEVNKLALKPSDSLQLHLWLFDDSLFFQKRKSETGFSTLKKIMGKTE